MDTLYAPAKVEAAAAKRWASERTMEKALAKEGKPYYFADGPPYATAAIHLGTAWNKVLKDTFLRQLRMTGYRPWAQPGFDTHGTPIEVKVEKELGFESKKDIERYGIGRFIEKCKEFATKNIATMSGQFVDLGVWMDWEKPYLTLHNAYIEGAWHTFKAAAERGLLYKGAMPGHVCTRCETVVAYNEIEHRKLTDPAVYVKLKVKGKDEFLVIWTTTPWTLPSNTGVMAHPEFSYAKVKVNGEVLVVAQELVERFLAAIGQQGNVVGTVKGSALEGVEYEHPLKAQVPVQQSLKSAHRVVLSARYVTLDAGTGLVHCAPGHGAEDFAVGKENGLPVVSPIGLDGVFRAEAGSWLAGKQAKAADPAIIAKLNEAHALVKKESVTHDYPTCWRCQTPLLLLNVPQWFFRVSAVREQLLAENGKVKWQPAWAGERFRDWLQNLGDWPVSRQRYWGIPLPIWECACGAIEVVGSFAELAKKGGLKKEIDFHRPAIDEVSWECGKCGERMRRVPEVLDVWFDSGVSTWASLGYPREQKAFKELWPAKLEMEGPDQVRGWWNSQLITSVLAFGRAPFESVLLHGFVLDAKGLKMSKSLGNVVGPEDVIARHGRDVLRFYLLSRAAWEDFSFNWEGAKEVQRVLNIFWNVANFAESYAPKDVEKAPLEPEDAWLLSRLEGVGALGKRCYVERSVHVYVEALQRFVVDDLSRWYVKLIRDRVSPGASGESKRAAQWALRAAVEETCRLLAPVAPFISDEVHRSLFGKGSVHLLEWPSESGRRNERLEERMRVAEAAVEAVNALRAEKGVKLRWPIDAIRIAPKGKAAQEAVEELSGVIALLGNAKKVEVVKTGEKEFEHGSVGLGEVLKEEAFLREVVRMVQEMRKKAGLTVGDKIVLTVEAGKAENALREIGGEVGAKEVVFGKVEGGSALEFEGRSVRVALRKA